MSNEPDRISVSTVTTTPSEQMLSHEMVQLVMPEVLELIRKNQYAVIRSALSEWHPPDLAELLEDIELPEDQVTFFRAWPREEALSLFEELSDEAKAALIENLTHRERLWLLNAMSPDERADMFAEVEDEDRGQILELLSPKARADIMRLLSYPPESAGGIMTTAYASVPETATVDEATRLVRTIAQYAETIYTVYVVDSNGILTGVIGLRSLILAAPDAYIRDVMETAIISVDDMDDQEEVAWRLRNYDLTAIPVVDGEKRLLGIVTVDDVLDVIREENTEDTYKMAAIQEYETPYLDTSVFRLARQRLPWLLILVVGGFLSGYVIQRYEMLLQQLVVLMFFVPALTDSGGNAGTQVSTMVIRSMATRELGVGDAWAVLRKETLVALLVGAAMGILTVGRAMFVEMNWRLWGTVGIAMAAVVFAAIIIGGLLPLGLKKIGLDPALMSSPFLTTIVDTFALIIYFEVARWFLI